VVAEELRQSSKVHTAGEHGEFRRAEPQVENLDELKILEGKKEDQLQP